MELDRDLFLPVSREDMARRGWDFYDFLLSTGDAYVDHPSCLLYTSHAGILLCKPPGINGLMFPVVASHPI